MKYFLTVRLIGGAGHGPQHLIPMLVSVLHTFLVQNEGQVALALPQAKEAEKPKLGNLVQFFSDNSDALEQLADKIEEKRALRDLIAVERIKPIPSPTSGWVAYTRYRLSSRKRGKKDHDEFYAKKMQKRAEAVADLQQIPVIFMEPKSNEGGRFGMGVKILRRDTPPDSQGNLNGYGLSSHSQPVWVPFLA